LGIEFKIGCAERREKEPIKAKMYSLLIGSYRITKTTKEPDYNLEEWYEKASESTHHAIQKYSE
jgi:hypothetical protein